MAANKQQSAQQITKGLISYLKKTRQLGILPQLVRESLKASQSQQNTNTAVVTTAIKLKPAQTSQLATTLTKVMGRDIKVTNTVDQAIIGGLHIRIGDIVIDQSIKHNIETLAKQLAS